MRWLTAIGVLCFASTAAADVIKLTNGGTLVGIVLRDSKGTVLLQMKYATLTLGRSEIISIEKTGEPIPGSSGMRLARWDNCIRDVVARPWAARIEQVPATVIDKGVLKNVPYISHRAGSYELNIYGDPDSPAALEIGVHKALVNDEAARKECLESLALMLPDPKDVEMLRSLDLAQDKKERLEMTFEVTPAAAEDAFEGWWISVYHAQGLDASRAGTENLKLITVDEKELREDEEEAEKQIVVNAKLLNKKPPSRSGTHPETVYIWRPGELRLARPVLKSKTPGVRRVYVKGFGRGGAGYARMGRAGGTRAPK